MRIQRLGPHDSLAFHEESQAYKVVSGFLAHAVGRSITLTQTTLTDVYTYLEVGGATAYQLTITYTDSGKGTIQSVTRTA